MFPDLNEPIDKASRPNNIAAAIKAPPSLGNVPVSRSESEGVLSGPAGGLTIAPIGAGSGLAGLDLTVSPGKQPIKPGRDSSGIITADSIAAAMGNDMQRPGGVFGSIDMAGANAIMARENKARGEMIDSSIKANGGAGMAILGADANGVTQTDRDNAEKTARWRQDDLLAKARYNPIAAGVSASIVNGDSHLAAEGIRTNANYAVEIARQGITARGQDLNFSGLIAQQGLTARGQDLTAENQRADNQLSAIRTGIDVGRFGLEKQAAQRQQAVSDALIQANASGDPAKIAQARQAAVSAGLKVEPAASLQHVETDRGTMVFDPRTGRMTPATGPDGAPVGSGKALTEFQGKSTSFGMRAQEASQVIDKVGQGGKVQPSLLKRTVEAVPLVGEGLGMAANSLQSPEQQQVEQAQRDFVNAVLRQESGAAISASEFDNARKQYFPQPGDSAEVVAQKQRNREMAIDGFRISAGPGARNIGGAPAQAGQAAQQPKAAQMAAAPKVGTVDGKHVFLGGNPADPASWAEVR